MTENRELTPRKAHELYNEDGLSNSQIGEKYDVSESTVSRRRKTYREMQDDISTTVEGKIEELDITESIADEEPENNPYSVVECPNCKQDMEKPDTAGEHDCPNCEVTLKFDESEI